MMRELMAYGLVVGALVAAAGWCLEALCRLARRPTRWVWLGALATTLVMMIAAPQRRPAMVPAAVLAQATPGAAARTDGAGSRLSLGTLTHAALAAVLRPVDAALATAARVPGAADAWIGAAWASLAALLIVLFTIAYGRLRRSARDWPITDVQGTRVRLAPEFGPAAVGLVAPEIVLPRWMLAHTAEQQRLALSHEGEHVRARDPLLLAMGCGAAVLMPWHPAVWWMLGRLRLAVELDCDSRVLRRRGISARAYGNALLDLASRCSGSLLGSPALAHGATHLERRLLAMTSQPSRFARARATVLTALAVTSLVAACEARLPTSSEVEHMDARAAERRVSTVGGVDSTAEYRVDGIVVARSTALALAPSEIVSIEIRRPKSGEPGRASVSIRTTKALAEGHSAVRHMHVAEAPHLVRKTDSGAVSLEPRNGMVVAADSPATRTRFAKDNFNGLIVIDGARADRGALARLTPAEIESVEVLKGGAAQQLYPEPEAANGVIVIKTVKGSGT